MICMQIYDFQNLIKSVMGFVLKNFPVVIWADFFFWYADEFLMFFYHAKTLYNKNKLLQPTLIV